MLAIWFRELVCGAEFYIRNSLWYLPFKRIIMYFYSRFTHFSSLITG